MSEDNDLTFEEGFDRLQTIAKRVTSEDVPVAEMCDLFAEGKGLQRALEDYLDRQKSRVEEIDRGEGLPAFEIVAPTASPPPSTSSPQLTEHTSTLGADGDIPF